MRQEDRVAFDHALKQCGVPEVDRPRLLMMVLRTYMAGRRDLLKEIEVSGQKVVVHDYHPGFAEQGRS